MEKTVLVFHHNDLDGMGVKLIGINRAKELGCQVKTFKCTYSYIDDLINSTLNHTPLSSIEEIIIGDIGIREDTAERLDALYKDDLKIVLRDHHSSAEHLNKYEWAKVSEVDQFGNPQCGTMALALCYPIASCDHLVLCSVINAWDCWTWVDNNLEVARDLNTLYYHLGEEKFTEYMLNLTKDQLNDAKNLISGEMKTVVDVLNRITEKTAYKCQKDLIIADFSFPSRRRHFHKNIVLKCGIIFCSDSVSSVSDIILKNNPELDYVMALNLPVVVSFRCQKDLPVPLPVIAKYTTGVGGGHPHSAGASISHYQMNSLISKIMKSLNMKGVIDVVDLKCNN